MDTYQDDDGETRRIHGTSRRPSASRAIGDGYGMCPRCGGPTINCIKADDVCLDDNCGHSGTVYENTSWG